MVSSMVDLCWFVRGGYRIGHRLRKQPDMIIYFKTLQFVAQIQKQHLGSTIVKLGRNA
jgi:hypothetical protein